MDSFLAQRYPTVEQTLANNASSLYQQKRLLLADLRMLLGSVGCVLIAIAYLRDVSFIPLVLRMMAQLSLSVPSKSLASLLLSDREKNEQCMFLLVAVFLGAFVSLVVHTIYPPYKTSNMDDHMLHGGFTVQFIGERLPCGRWECYLYDMLIFCSQYVYFCLIWTTDSLVVPEGRVTDIFSDEAAAENDLISDGFDGNVFLLTIDLLACVKQVLEKREAEVESQQATDERLNTAVSASLFLRRFV